MCCGWNCPNKSAIHWSDKPALPRRFISPNLLTAPDFKTLPVSLSSDFNADTTAIYVQDQIMLANDWNMLLGGRFDQFKQKQTNRFTQ
jgi:outer membrane receptor protein involved in Fe transport